MAGLWDRIRTVNAVARARKGAIHRQPARRPDSDASVVEELQTASPAIKEAIAEARAVGGADPAPRDQTAAQKMRESKFGKGFGAPVED
jgi:hypothetical protein